MFCDIANDVGTFQSMFSPYNLKVPNKPMPRGEGGGGSDLAIWFGFRYVNEPSIKPAV